MKYSLLATVSVSQSALPGVGRMMLASAENKAHTERHSEILGKETFYSWTKKKKRKGRQDSTYILSLTHCKCEKNIQVSFATWFEEQL